MVVRHSRKIKQNLKRKGFILEERDHSYYSYIAISGKKTEIWTKISHGSNQDISDDLLKHMSDQCKLSKADFLDLVDCPLTREQYEEKLKLKDIEL
jgi:hypothetical protein